MIVLKNCYKNVLNTLTCFDNWTNEMAKWIDECVDSREEEIEVYKWNPV